ncbi:MAG: tetratricopeptide repeat protein [Gammaproteobacteria bacterium]|nr:tetratricopeptide repeat protein [Gammaproteobacteria bacterium]
MGKASRSKAERRRLREAQAAEAAARQEQAPADHVRRGWTSFFTADGPPSDFPLHAGLGVLLLAALVAVSYYPALTAGFIWDDVIFTSAQPVQAWSGIWDIWSDPKSLALEGHYWPVVYTSFWLEHKLWGFAPAGYHAVNLLLQLVNSLLVWRLMWRLAVPGAWLIAAVFAVHPLHVESVAWVIERKDLLSGAFYLGAVLVWLRFAEATRRRDYFLALGLFAASLLSKTVTVTLPAALLVLAWWKRGRVTGADALRLLPFFAVGFAFAFGDTAYYASREPLDLDYSFVERLQIATHALWFYVGKLLWPVDLAVIYPFWEVGAGRWAEWGYVAAAAALVAGLWQARGRIGRGPLAAALFYGVTLSPVLGFVDFGYMQFSFVADRFQYLAGIGVMAVLVGAGTHAAGRLAGVARKSVLGAALLGIAVLASLSWQQSHLYRDEITFFSHIIAHNPQGRDAHHNLGKALQDAGRMDEALEAARTAVEQRPDFAGAHANLGLALKHFGRFDEAEEVLRRGLQADPRNKNVLQNLGEVIRQQGRHEESLQWYDAVLRRDREYTLAYASKGDALFALERYGEAVANLKKALALTPDMPQAPLMHTLIGEAAREVERFEEAERHYRDALRIEPGLFRAHTGLAGLLIDRNRSEEADRHLQNVRMRHPDDADGLQGVAELFRKRQQYGKALEWYDAVFEADRDYTQAYAGKGDALFRLGRYEEAIQSLGRAIALEPGMSTVPTLRVLIGEAHQKLGRLEEALAQYELVLADDPHNPGAIDRLAMVRHDQGRFAESLELYRKHISLDPGNANAHSNLGIVLYRMGRTGEAREALEHALTLDPSIDMARTVLDLVRKGE